MNFKQSLVVTTALSAVGALAATSAMAAEKPKLKISGYQETYFGIASDRDPGGNTTSGTPTYQGGSAVSDGSFGIVQYGEIRFTATGTTDSGMKWGVRFEDVQDEADGNRVSDNKKQSTDEAHLWIEGSWGRLEIGGQDGASDRMRESSYNLVPWDPRIPSVWMDTRGNRLRGGEDQSNINDSSDDTKLTYWTPRISGFQAAYSYAPHTDARGSVLTTDEPFHEAGVRWRGKVGGGRLGVAATYTLQANAAPGGDDVDAWKIGASYSHSGFTVAAMYLDMGERRASVAGEEGSQWDIGIAYGQGPWEVGIRYVDAQHDVSGASDDEYTQIDIFGSYNLGGGLAVSGGVAIIDNDASTASNGADGWVGILKLNAAF